MDKQFEVIISTRSNFLKLIEGLSVEQLNKIPEGFNNNIAWNFGHIIVSQQVLCYLRAGLIPVIDDTLIKKYQKGTKPETFIDIAEIELLKQKLLSLIEVLKEDIKKGMFGSYPSYMTSFGVELASVEDAVHYFAMHDGLHLGYSLAIKKLV